VLYFCALAFSRSFTLCEPSKHYISQPADTLGEQYTVNPIRVLVADDHSLMRAGLRLLIEEVKGISVIGEAGSGDEALRLIKELRPNVVLLDIQMPGLNGFEVLGKTVEEFPDVRVVILTVHQAEQYAAHALREGAAGYLPKTAASSELELAIRTVAAGGTYVSPELSPGTSSERIRSPIVPPTLRPELTPRQHEVLRLIAEGLSTKDIALALRISAKTVETHRSQLMERLGIHDVAGLVRYAIRMGLVSVDE
jgi:DNA-binding NarL/FixJ family response regulator